MGKAYYNEIDPHACEWMQNLMDAGHIAPGLIDNRSIADVTPNDLKGFSQCHFFAGIGVWSSALRACGWPDDKPVWTGSAPCQPFSSAGQQAGFDDSRHLWPALFWLIRQCQPDIVIGEQVASKPARAWLDLVFDELESEGYTCGAAASLACGVGAPHKRQRTYWVAHAEGGRVNRGPASPASPGGPRDQSVEEPDLGSDPGQLADGWKLVSFAGDCRQSSEWEETDEPGDLCSICGLNYCEECKCPGPTQEGYEYEERPDGLYACLMADLQQQGPQGHDRDGNHRAQPGRVGTESPGSTGQGGGPGRVDNPVCGRYLPTDGEVQARGFLNQLSSGAGRPSPSPAFWGDPDWLFCRDNKWRPVEPGTFPLAYGAGSGMGRMQSGLRRLGYNAKTIQTLLREPRTLIARAGKNRTIRLKGYGNAIVKQQAMEFIQAIIDIQNNQPGDQ